MKLISLDDLKAFLEITSSTQDSLLNLIITNISARIESFCNRKFTKTSRTSYYSCEKDTVVTKKCYLDAYPVDTLLPLTVTYSGSVQTVDTDYFIWPEPGCVEFYTVLPYVRPRDIKIDYYGGYDEIDGVLEVPDDLKFACLIQCAFIFRRRKDIGLQNVKYTTKSNSGAVS